MGKKFKITLKMDDDGVLITGGGKIDKTGMIALVHALGEAFNLDRMDWAILAATADFHSERGGLEIHVPDLSKDDE